jgi:hypothetical protein
VGGVVHLFILRFETGDVYPAYSSLRSDPLGARALYDSLQSFDDIQVRRNYHLLHSVKTEDDTTFFYLGASPPEYDSVSEEVVKVFDRLTQSGGRLVVSYLPTHKKIEKKKCTKEGIDADDKASPAFDDEAQNLQQDKHDLTDTPPSNESESQKSDDHETPKKPSKKKFVSMKEHWGIGFDYYENIPSKDDKYPAVQATTGRPELPPAISWHTNLYFETFDGAWQVIYTCQGRPVIIERKFGEGSIVLSADSFFVSNEALRSERYTPLLIWLMGPNSKIIFDEAHFGIYKRPGVASLLRHYRFQWFFAALAVLALLFVWKNTVYFIPPLKDDGLKETDVVSEKDYTQGLIALLRRNIGGGKILDVCGNEWEQSFMKDKRIQLVTFERVKDTLKAISSQPKKTINPVDGYRNISRIISED